MGMPLHPSVWDIALRLTLAMTAGAVIGLNREAQGEKAGLRTNMLVALAATVAMIQANLLLSAAGKTPTSFSTMDVMRLPLGILSGMGFIGAGAILRRGELVIGVTTAATLWTVTVIGLCFGGGQLVLGSVATLLAVILIWLLKRLDSRFVHVQRAILRVRAADGVDLKALVRAALPALFRLTLMDTVVRDDGLTLVYEVKWRDVNRESTPVEAIARLGDHDGVHAVEWRAMTKRG